MFYFKTGVLVGRFQPVHIGHEKIINIGLSLCDKLLVFVGSSNEEGTVRNPYSSDYRISLIERIYSKEIKDGRLIIRKINDISNENDLTPKWGKYVLNEAKKVLGQDVNLIVYGKDKNIFKCFPKNVVKNLTEVYVDRNALEISATKVREYIINNDRENFEKYVNSKIYGEYDNLRKVLLNL